MDVSVLKSAQMRGHSMSLAKCTKQICKAFGITRPKGGGPRSQFDRALKKAVKVAAKKRGQ